jgi:hypothetical protein
LNLTQEAIERNAFTVSAATTAFGAAPARPQSMKFLGSTRGKAKDELASPNATKRSSVGLAGMKKLFNSSSPDLNAGVEDLNAVPEGGVAGDSAGDGKGRHSRRWSKSLRNLKHGLSKKMSRVGSSRVFSSKTMSSPALVSPREDQEEQGEREWAGVMQDSRGDEGGDMGGDKGAMVGGATAVTRTASAVTTPAAAPKAQIKLATKTNSRLRRGNSSHNINPLAIAAMKVCYYIFQSIVSLCSV